MGWIPSAWPAGLRALPMAFAGLLALAGAAGAQSEPEREAPAQGHASPSLERGEAAPSPREGGGTEPDFLFQRPRVSLGLKGGIFFHRAGSDIYDFSVERFTIESGDFRGGSLAGEVAVWLGPRLELALGIEGARTTLPSEYEAWVEEDGSPIRQTTRLTQGPAVTAGVRRYLWPRGEQVGQFVWIPRTWNAYVGGGVGAMAYRFEQWGDFVLEEDESIFTEEFGSTGNTLFPFLKGGGEFGMSPRMALTVEARYHWAEGELGRDFRGFEPLDLSGLRLTAGLSYRF